MKRYMPLALLALLALVAAQAGASNLIVNGSFQSGDFTGWTLGTTSNGTAGAGFPVVTAWPLGGANAWEGEVGEVSFDGTQQGATLTQSFIGTGAATISMDWAASAPFAGNADGGEFTMILNGVQIAQYDTNSINQGDLLNGVLTANANLNNGTNTLEIDITRRYISVSDLTPLQYVTGIDVEGTPEPGSLILMGTGVLGLAGVLRRKIGF
ncbi:MAG: PEP-CTERM sorting domain-containing protein [Candidatus Sulfotelmatobacter sp.]